MRTLLRRRLPDGSHQDSVIDSISLTIGRGTDNQIELPGATVSQRHAKLTLGEPGKYLIESTSAAGLEVNGVAGVREQQLGPGDKVRIGDHTLTIQEPGVNVDLQVDLLLAQPAPKASMRTAAEGLSIPARPGAAPKAAAPAAPKPAAAPDKPADKAAPDKTSAKAPKPAKAARIIKPFKAPKDGDGPTVTLHDTGIGYRRTSWILGVLVLALSLALPLASRGTTGWPSFLPSDQLWTSGRMSGGHSYFGDDCGACHQELFERVTDDACASCHTTTKHHSDHPAIRGMDGFADLRCASCHREHDAVALDPENPAVCTGCHANPQFADFPALLPASDFGAAHPAFKPRVTTRTDTGAFREERLDQTPELKDWHGLIYNHALHLDAAGVRGPDGDKVLACGDCHVADQSRMGFQDLSYAKHCQGCHQLDAVLGGSTLRLPHADESMMRELLDKYLSRAPAAAPAPAPAADTRRRMGDSAERGSAGDLADEVRRTAGRLCSKCHELQTASTGLPKVRELSLKHTWLTHARFTHAEHEAMECTRCHAADTSTAGEDLLLPALGDCRTCHAGVDSAHGVSSTCIDCHRLHQASQPWREPVAKGERVSERRGSEQQ